MAFGLYKANGLSDLLLSGRNEIEISHVVSNTRIPNLYVLNAGSPITHLGELVNSPRMAEIIQSLRQSYDVVLVDSPPLLAVSDALALAGLADMTLLVVERGRAKSANVQTACRMLRDVGAASIGLVVNHAEPAIEYGYQDIGIRALSEPRITSKIRGPTSNNRKATGQTYAEYMQSLQVRTHE
jgi:Mrp family chromosome partitioning ATPase